MRVLIATGSRADWGLLEPVAKALRTAGEDVLLLITGSHLSQQFGATVSEISNEYFGYCAPCIVDWDNPAGVTKSLGMGLIHYSDVVANTRPDCVVILGDRYEMVGVALAAYTASIPIVHFQGGDRTKGSLDDGYRECITSLASLHLVGSTDALSVLHKGPSYNVGSLACVPPFGYEAEDIVDYIVCLHGEDLDEVIKGLPGRARYGFIGTNADAGGATRQQVLQAIGGFARHKFANSLSRKEYWSWLAGANAIIGNSSSGIFEAPMVGTYTINIGDRQNGRLKTPSIIDVPCEATAIADAIKTVEQYVGGESEPDEFKTPYYKPDTIKRSVQLIREFFN